MQRLVLPLGLQGKDVMMKDAENGCGKTLAYLLPALRVIEQCPSHTDAMRSEREKQEGQWWYRKHRNRRSVLLSKG